MTGEIMKNFEFQAAGRSYCLHDPENELPPADVTIGHLLLLRTDEPRFLRLANATDARGPGCGLWNGDWLRRVRRRRQPHPAQAPTPEVISPC